MGLCNNRGLLEFNDACIRASWFSLLPFGLVCILCLSKLPKPRLIRQFLHFLKSPLKNFLTLREAEALDNKPEGNRATEEGNGEEFPKSQLHRHNAVLMFIGVAEGLCWVAGGSFQLYNTTDHWTGILCYALAISWTYSAIRPLSRSTFSPPYDVAVLYLLFFFGSLVDIGGVLYDRAVLLSPPPSTLSLSIRSANLLAIVLSLTIIFNIPSEIPSSKVDSQEIVSEDHSSLFPLLTAIRATR